MSSGAKHTVTLGFVISLAGVVTRQNEYRWCWLDDMLQKAIVGLTCAAEAQNQFAATSFLSMLGRVYPIPYERPKIRAARSKHAPL
jgi:hypothetical protein